MVGRLIWETHQRCKENILQDQGKMGGWDQGDGHRTIPKQLPIDVHLHWKWTRKGASSNAVRHHVRPLWKREYIRGLVESHRIRRGALIYPEVEEVVLIVREENNRGDGCCSCSKGSRSSTQGSHHWETIEPCMLNGYQGTRGGWYRTYGSGTGVKT